MSTNYPYVLSQDNAAETVNNLGTFYGNFRKPTISELRKQFLDYSQYEKGFSPETIIKYHDCLRCFIHNVGDLPVDKIEIGHFVELRKRLRHRAVGDARIASIVFAMKSFLRYCREVLELSCLSPEKVKSPKRSKREVTYLTNDEVEKFTRAIKIYDTWTGKKKQRKVNIHGLRFRTLVEVLLGTGMRISEALSLNIADVDFDNSQATIIGKGDKERTIFFSDDALRWVKKYLGIRSDTSEPLFVSHPKATRLKRTDIWRFFERYSARAGLDKKVTAHMLRHTFATNMLYNGANLFTIKELLGHHDISITARAYIGVDKRKIKEQHAKFLNYGLDVRH